MNDLDKILLNCLKLIAEEQNKPTKDKHGLVAAAIVTSKYPVVYSTTLKITPEECKHAERSVIEKFQKLYGKVPEDAILFTTLSPCFEPMSDRIGDDCCKLIEQVGIKKVYTGLDDWSQEEHDHNHYKKDINFDLIQTQNKEVKKLCTQLLDVIEHLQKID